MKKKMSRFLFMALFVFIILSLFIVLTQINHMNGSEEMNSSQTNYDNSIIEEDNSLSDGNPLVVDKELPFDSGINDISVSFYTNGGPIVQDANVAQNSLLTRPNDPEREEFLFAGWYIDNISFNNEYNFDIPVTEAFTLYAKWIIYEQTVWYETEYNFDSELVLPTPTKTGFTFGGWYIDINCTIPFDLETMPAEDFSIYAKWTINDCTVSFECNGGAPLSAVTQDYGTLFIPDAPQRQGYAFQGWYSDSELTQQVDGSFYLTEDITLYADWEEIVYGSITRDPGLTGGDLLVTIDGDTVTFDGEIEWYFEDEELGRAYGNRVGVQITAPQSQELYDITVEIGENTYTTLFDGKDYFWWYPLVTAAGQEFTATVTWNSSSVQTFTIVIDEQATLMDAIVSGTIERDPGLTGGDCVATVDGNTITFAGEIDWYFEDEELGRDYGNRVGVQINAPDKYEYDPSIATVVIGENTYEAGTLFNSEKLYFWWYPLITAAGQEFTATVTWNTSSVQTFTIVIDEQATLMEAIVSGTIERDPGLTGGDCVATVDGDTITFDGEIDWYPEDVELGRVRGNRVGVQINAPDKYEYDPSIATVVIGENTYEAGTLFNSEKLYFWWYPLVTAAGQEFTATVTWNTSSVQTFTIVIDEQATLQAALNDIVFDKNSDDATGQMENQQIRQGQTEQLNANSFERTGYTFSGWATSFDGEVVYIDEDMYTMGSEPVYTLYAVWTVNQYTITYVVDHNYGEAVQEMIPIREGYVFDGWCIDEYRVIPFDHTSMLVEDVTLYAKWIDLSDPLGVAYLHLKNGHYYDIYNGEDDGIFYTDIEINVHTFFNEVFPMVDYYPESMLFMGEFGICFLYANAYEAYESSLIFQPLVDEDENMSLFVDDCFVVGATELGFDIIDLKNDIVFNNDFYYLERENNAKLLRYNGNNTDVTIPATVNGKPVISIGYNAFYGDINTITIPTTVANVDTNAFAKLYRSGYQFEGLYFDEEFINEFDNLLPFSQDTTLYVNWEQATDATITFEANGGTDISSLTLSVGSAIPELDESEKTGYNFTGWYLDSQLTLPFDLTQMPAYDITLYAGWIDFLEEIYNTKGNVFVDLGFPIELNFTDDAEEINEALSIYCSRGYGNILNGIKKPISFLHLDTLFCLNYDNIDDAIDLYNYYISFEATDADVEIRGSAVFISPPSMLDYLLYDIYVENDTIYMEKEDGFTFLIYTGHEEHVIIPSQYMNKPVVEIGCNAFNIYGTNEDLITVTLPDTIKKLRYSAFGHCVNLESVIIPQNSQLTYIGVFAFSNCTSLTEFTVPDSVECIGEAAFAWSGLTNIYYPTNCLIESVEDSTFYGCQSLQTITLPDSITSIEEYAFYNSGLTSINVPDSVEYIGENAFGYSGLTNIYYPTNCLIESVEDSTFYGCQSLQTITLPDSITSIEEYAFYNSGLTSINVSSNIDYIGANAFSNTPWYNNLADGEVYIGKVFYAYKGEMPANTTINVLPGTVGVSSISSNSLACINIPASVRSIGRISSNNLIGINVDQYNDYYTSIDGILYNKAETEIICYPRGKTDIAYTIPSSVTQIDSYSFNNSYLEEITIPSSVQFIGEDAFNGCYNLTTITVSENNQYYKSIDGILYNKAETEIIYYPRGKTDSVYYVPSGVLTIEGRAFEGNNNLEEIYLADSVTEIRRDAFYNCYNLTNVEIGVNSQLSIIGDSAFRYTAITSIYLPSGLIEIGYDAFSYCSDLAAINVDANNQYYTSIDGILYNKAETEIIYYPRGKTDSVYYIPSGVLTIEENAFYYNNNLEEIYLADSVNEIGESAFYYCSNLTNVDIGVNSQLSIIGNSAFSYTAITGIYLPSGLIEIGYDALNNCDVLATITVSENNQYYKSIDGILYNKAETEIIYYPRGKTDIAYTIPSNVTQIDSCSFDNSYLEEITIPSSVQFIGENAFNGCYNLTTITVNENNQYYKSIDGILYNKAGTEIICYPRGKTDIAYTIPSNVTQIIDSYSFDNSYLEEITIPSSVQFIGEDAFNGCYNLTTITVSENNQYYKSIDGILYNKAGTEIICYPRGKTDIAYTIPSSVTQIDSYSFNNSYLEEITIPQSMQFIGYYAFSCYILTSIIVEAISPFTIDSGAFNGCYQLVAIYVPAQSVNEYKLAEGWSDYADIIFALQT